MSLNAIGQDIFDTLDLQGIEIFSQRYEKLLPQKLVTVDSVVLAEYFASNLADLIAGATPLFVKSYSPGGLASVSFRGTAASHTHLIWNGINLNSPMSGQTDLSLIPIFFIDRVSISGGTSASSTALAGLGGNIIMKTEADFHNKLAIDLAQEIGSFETFRTFGKVNLGNRIFQSSTRFLMANSENHFSYPDNSVSAENPPMKTRSGASYHQKGLLQEFNFSAGLHSILYAKLWMQDDRRGIPSNIVANNIPENEELNDQSVRFILGFERKNHNSGLIIQTSMLNSLMNYQNILAGINTDNRISSSCNFVNYSFQGIKNLSLAAGGGINYHKATSENYEKTQTRQELNINGSINYNLEDKLVLQLSMRQDFIDQNFAPFIPSFGFSYRIRKASPFLLKGSASRAFKSPSLNDLYWVPGGNPDLTEERGKNYELGVSFSKSIKNTLVTASITGFYADIINWITWQPDTLFSYWRPFNLRHVVSRGLEFDGNLASTIDQVSWNYQLKSTFTLAENIAGSTNDEFSERRQLVYMPGIVVNQSIRITWKGFSGNYTLNHTGKRYTTTDNSRYLPGYLVQDIALSKTILLSRSAFRMQLNVNNLANKYYQVIAWQPMPGRNFSFSLQYRFSK